MKVDNVFLAGIGTCIPERVTIDEAVERGWYAAALRESGGMISVAVGGDMPAPDMAVSAARDALKHSGHQPEDIDVLIHTPVFHQGPDIWSAPHYILHNTVDRPIPALELRQGCLGMVTSLRFAANLLTADANSTAVLVTAGDNFSTPNVDRWSVSDNYVLADGGCAVVLSKRGGFARLLSVGSVSIPQAELLHRGGDPLFPPSVTLGKPLDLDARVAHVREQWAKGVVPPVFHLGDVVNESVDATLAEAGLTMDDITEVAHSGVAWEQVKNGFLDPLGIDDSRGTWEFNRRMGHSGGTDQIAGLDHLLSTGRLQPGDHVLLLAAAVGMEVGSAVLEITRAP